VVVVVVVWRRCKKTRREHDGAGALAINRCYSHAWRRRRFRVVRDLISL